MGFVAATSLKIGDIVTGEQGMGQKAYYYHHPFMVVSKAGTNLTLRNCTSHESAIFTTVEIKDADKTGNKYWKTGASSFLVQNGDLMTVPTVVQVLTGTKEVQGFEQITRQVVNPDGSMAFYPEIHPVIYTQPVYTPMYSATQYYRSGNVSEAWIKDNL